MSSRPHSHGFSATVTRFAALAPLSDDDRAALQSAESNARKVSRYRDMIAEGSPVAGPTILVWGWAARVRVFADGRRQILSFLLPGDLIGPWQSADMTAPTTVTAMTEAWIAPGPAASTPGITAAYMKSSAQEERLLHRQIARIGRLSANERIADWLFELHDRLKAAGLAQNWRFPLPLTQETISDTLGLTSVHVNRMLQSMRRDGLVQINNGAVTLLNPERMAALANLRQRPATWHESASAA